MASVVLNLCIASIWAVCVSCPFTAVATGEAREQLHTWEHQLQARDAVSSLPLQRSVRLFVPAFSGADQLGIRVANIIRLQVMHDFDQGTGGDEAPQFGRATLLWDDEPLPETSYKGALSAALRFDVLADIVLWGRAYELPDGVVIQCHLTIAPLADRRPRERPEQWTIVVEEANGTPHVVNRGLPDRQYDFEPIILEPGLVERYRSIPALQIYADRSYSRPIGKMGSDFRALIYEAGAVLVQSGNIRRWVPLPALTAGRTEVIDFTGAIVRIMRGDWKGARSLLLRVLETSTIPRSLQLDALVLRGFAEEWSRKSS